MLLLWANGLQNGMLIGVCFKQAEEENFRNHETSFATGGLAFLPFILGCVGRGILGALDFGFSGTSTA